MKKLIIIHEKTRAKVKARKARLLGGASALLALCSLGQIIPPPPLPPVNTNLIAHKFAAPAAQRQFISIEFEYTNIIYPIESSTDLVTWVPEGFATNATVRVIFPVTNAPVKFFRAGPALYYGTWTNQGATNG